MKDIWNMNLMRKLAKKLRLSKINNLSHLKSKKKLRDGTKKKRYKLKK